MPNSVRMGDSYSVTIRGSYTGTSSGNAFLISLIQFDSRPCQASAQAENDWANSNNTLIQFYFAPNSDPSQGSVGIFERQSPFERTDGFTAGDLGTRHVCSYLYAHSIQPADTTPPIATADKTFTVKG